MAASITGSVGNPTPRGRAAENDPFDVQTVQKLLAAAGTSLQNPALAPQMTNGVLTPDTVLAIQAFQQGPMHLTTADGRIDVNGRTWRALVRAAGEVDTNPEGWPALPSFQPLTDAQRAATFGTFTYELDAGSSDPDAITILTRSAEYRTTRVTIPQLGPLRGGHRTVEFHSKAANQFIALWEAWEQANLLDRILTWDGSYVPRFQRRTARVVGVSPLSNHSWGTAFDINAAYNGLGKTPAIIWEQGCVFELVALAHEHGFFWGGHFARRPDGMHFEVAQIV